MLEYLKIIWTPSHSCMSVVRLIQYFGVLLVLLSSNALAIDLQAIAVGIHKSPHWDYYSYEKGADKAVIESILQMAELNNDECRVIVKTLMLLADDEPTRNKWFKVLALNRLIFDVPADFKRSVFLSPSGFLSPIELPVDGALLLWPVELRDGAFRIVSRSAGYSGGDYDGLREFDAFATKFKRRIKGVASASNW